MGHPLEAVDWRIKRADQHLATLKRKSRAFFNQEDDSIVGHFERDTSEYVFRISGEPPDPRIGLFVGEFAHNLRAALDNLLWQLVLLRGGAPTTKTQFPIYESREGYVSNLRKLRGVSADDRALIEACQPYQSGGDAAKTYLSLLAWLNNVDKHRFVHVGSAIPRGLPLRISFHGGKSEFAGLFPLVPRIVKDVGKIVNVRHAPLVGSDDRTELVRVLIEPSGPNPEMDMDGDVPVQISMSDPKQALILNDLHAMRNVVLGVIEAFRPRFNVVRGIS